MDDGGKPGQPAPVHARSTVTTASVARPKAKKTASHGNGIGSQQISRLLRSLPAFGGISDANLKRIAAVTKLQAVNRGEVLVEEGAPSKTLYIVLRGRFLVSTNEMLIAEIGVGEPIGELGFFAKSPRTATVRALRNGMVIALDRSAYDKLARTTPELNDVILASLAERLIETAPRRKRMAPVRAKTVALVPACGASLPGVFVQKLTAAVGELSGKACILTPTDFEGVSRDGFAEKLAQFEAAHDLVVLVSNTDDFERGNESWAKTIAGHCDAVYLVGEKKLGRAPPVPISRLERFVLNGMPAENIHLILWREMVRAPIRNTAQWQQDRKTALTHHVALDDAGDFRRLARFLAGQAIGVVMCGGGAFGTAHLGAIKALREAGIEFDMYGGTSVGAAMAAALTVMNPDRVMELCDDIFVRSKAMGRVTIPVHSVIDHKRFDEQMQKHYGGYRVEDLPVNYFAVSTSLTKNDMVIIREGEVWEAVRASSSIPAVFPPFIRPDGEVLIDGALTDNVPINVMRSLKPGPNLILNFEKRDPWRIESPYDALPGRSEALRRLAIRKKEDARFPSIFSVLSRTMVITARRLIENTDIGDDVLMEMPVMKGMSFLNWRMGRKQYEHAYRAMAEALSNAHCDGDVMATLRKAADIIEA